MKLHLLYPASPINRKSVDEDFAEEFWAVQARGLQASVADDSFVDKSLEAYPPIPPYALVAYRGWMLNLDTYGRLEAQVEAAGATMLTPKNAYALTHHLPNWFPICEDLTARTVLLSEDSDFRKELEAKTAGWGGYFVKDWVKSLSTAPGSVAHNADEVAEVVRLLKHYRGAIEGGVCVRELTRFQPDSETRFFVVDGKAYGGTTDGIPPIVVECARRLRGSTFYSVDVARTVTGEWQIVELGDGQVSDRKSWPLARFVDLLTRLGQAPTLDTQKKLQT